MAAGNFTLFNQGRLAALNGSIVLGTDAIAVALLTSAYTPDALHDTWADVSANECADVDYAQQALATQTITEAAGVVTYDSADVSFGSAVSITAKYAVFIKGTAGALVGTEPLLGYVDLDTGGGSVSSTNSTFSVNTPSGILTSP